MLREHDGEGGESGAADTRYGEELDEAGYVVGFTDDIRFLLDLREDVVEVAGGLERRVPETAEGFESVPIASFFDVPARGFGAEVDAYDKGNGRDEC